MAIEVIGQVGPQFLADGVTAPKRLGKAGEQIIGQLHGRFYEQVYRGNVFSVGSSTTALSANTITLTATTTPIVGIWNPANSPVNVVVLRAALQVSVQAASSTAQGSWVWATSVGNAVITTGSTPMSRKTLSAAGAYAKGFPGGVALTGLTNNLVILESADFGGGLAITTAAVPATAVVPVTTSMQDFEGALFVPPGGVLALLNTVSTTNLSVASRILWEEVAL